jgi:hypothetical protein
VRDSERFKTMRGRGGKLKDRGSKGRGGKGRM